MKAVVYEKYGPPDALELREIEQPTPAAGEVLLRVHASCVSAGDWHMLTATYFAVRLFWGLLRPKKKVLGFDVSGTVVAVGAGATRFAVGDEVFGASDDGGAFAEFMCAPEAGLARPIHEAPAESAETPTWTALRRRSRSSTTRQVASGRERRRALPGRRFHTLASVFMNRSG